MLHGSETRAGNGLGGPSQGVQREPLFLAINSQLLGGRFGYFFLLGGGEREPGATERGDGSIC